MKAFAFYDTAGSVKHLVEQSDRHAAAIASRAAAEYYGAEILEAGIEDNPENFTRFFLVRRAAESAADPAANKISLAFSVENRPGSLVAVLNELAAMGTNLTKIESRPVHGKPWEYIFYVDCQIQSSGEGSRALAGARQRIAPWSRSWDATEKRLLDPRTRAGTALESIRAPKQKGTGRSPSPFWLFLIPTGSRSDKPRR